MRDSLVHMVIHDLRNPLAAIAMFANLLDDAERERLSEKGPGHVGLIIKSTDVLIEMINSMLDVSKMESGQMELNLAACDLGALAREVVSRMEALKGERRITLALPEQPVLVRGDAQLLSRLVQNLVGNALKFVPGETGRIDIALEPGGGGCGVPSGTTAPASPPNTRRRSSTNSGRRTARLQGHVTPAGWG